MPSKPKIPLWYVSFVVGAGASFLLCELLWSTFPKKVCFFSWLLHLFNAFSTAKINEHVIGKPVDVFMLWGVGGHVLRLGFVLIIFVFVMLYDYDTAKIFGVLTVFLYLINMVFEVYELHTRADK